MENLIYRHEYKYLVSTNQIEEIKHRLDGLVSIDSHARDTGFYNISSLYFDDIYNRCFYENENGSDPREKFRIRIYNHDPGRITLECKRKERGKTLKTSCKLSREQYDHILRREIVEDLEHQPGVLRRLSLEMMMNGMKPIVIVEYDRIPYVYKNGNVRITFDTNLSSSPEVEAFLQGSMHKRAVMPVGMHLMEVKWDDFMPDEIYRALQVDNLNHTAYSKYYLCRKYHL